MIGWRPAAPLPAAPRLPTCAGPALERQAAHERGEGGAAVGGVRGRRGRDERGAVSARGRRRGGGGICRGLGRKRAGHRLHVLPDGFNVQGGEQRRPAGLQGGRQREAGRWRTAACTAACTAAWAAAVKRGGRRPAGGRRCTLQCSEAASGRRCGGRATGCGAPLGLLPPTPSPPSGWPVRVPWQPLARQVAAGCAGRPREAGWRGQGSQAVPILGLRAPGRAAERARRWPLRLETFAHALDRGLLGSSWCLQAGRRPLRTKIYYCMIPSSHLRLLVCAAAGKQRRGGADTAGSGGRRDPVPSR